VLRIETRKCRDCGRKYDVSFDTRAAYAHEPALSLDKDARGPDDLACPGCRGEQFAVVLQVGTGIHLGGDGGVGRDFPYFDNGLGIWIRSHQHRREECKRRGVVPMEENGARMIEEVHAARVRQAEQDETAYNEMLAEQQADPVMREAMGKLQERIAGARSPEEARAMAGMRRS
jgi:hypothetical protein